MFIDLDVRYPAVFHMYHLAGAFCDVGVVRDDYHGAAVFKAHFLQKLQYHDAGLRIECTGRFVAQDDLRVLGERACDRDAIFRSRWMKVRSDRICITGST